MKKIIINNRDLDDIHVDTYSVFDMERETEMEIDHYNESHGTDYDYDSFDIDYDMEGYLGALSRASIECMQDQLADDPIIKGIELISSQSPKYYNYTTDSFTASFEYDPKKLIEWIGKNEEGWREYIKSWDSIRYDDKIYLNSLDFNQGTIEVDDPIWSESEKKYIKNIIIKRLEDCEDIAASMIAFYLKNTIYQVDDPFLWYYEDMIEKVYAGEYITIKKAENNEEEAV